VLALGATRARVVRQLLTESMLISIAGGLLGCVLALWSFPLVALALPALAPPEVPTFVLDLDFAPDFRVLSFAMALTFGTAILFGLAPALHVSKTDLLSVIRQDSAVTGSSRGGGAAARNAGRGAGGALSMALMIAAGLLLRRLYATHTVDPGFVYRDVAYVHFGLDGLPYEGEEAAMLRQRLRDEVEALPGVDCFASGVSPTPWKSPSVTLTARRTITRE
jgi:hypothetical protein